MELREIKHDLEKKLKAAQDKLNDRYSELTQDARDDLMEVIDDLQLKLNLAERGIKMEAERLHKEADDVYDAAEALSARIKAFIYRNPVYVICGVALILIVLVLVFA
jgi:ElaB/YqjD/DUF883 family membrane-anchored ribosome-binding protein